MKPVASDERKIPWSINLGKQLVCAARNVDIN